jgi:hypothetical protein
MLAGLTFRVGRADESLARGGVTHMIEHLALYPVPEGTERALAREGADPTAGRGASRIPRARPGSVPFPQGLTELGGRSGNRSRG